MRNKIDVEKLEVLCPNCGKPLNKSNGFVSNDSEGYICLDCYIGVVVYCIVE